MPIFDPSVGCDDEMIRIEEEENARVEFYKEHMRSICRVAKAILKSPSLIDLANISPDDRDSVKAAKVISLAEAIVREAVSRQTSKLI